MSVESIITENLDIWTSAIKTKSTSGRGSSNKLELYGIKKLRELILTLAVSGKLLPQEIDDEPALTYIETLQKEKNALIKERNFRKSKPSSEIDVSGYKFKLPANWCWKRLGDLFFVSSSSRVQKKDWQESGVPFYRAREIVQLARKGIAEDDLFISEELYQNLTKAGVYPEKKDIMVTGVGTIGVPYIVTSKDKFYFKDASVLIIKSTDSLYAEYIELFMKSPFWIDFIHEQSMGTTVHTLTIVRANEAHIAIPPLNEQKRIVKKVDELMALCDQLESQTEASIKAHQTLVKSLLETLTNAKDADELNESWQRISAHFDVLFTTEDSIDQLKQTILQLAVMGKLVKQDPNDEPASKLLERIAAEKEQLIKDKKIKKQKSHPKTDMGKFDLPYGWEMTRLSAVFGLITDGDHQAPPKTEKGVPFLVIGNLNTGYINFDDCRYVSEDYYEKLDWGKKPQAGDILYSVTGSYGIPVKVSSSEKFCVQRHVAIFKAVESSPIEYLNIFLKSHIAYRYSTRIATGIAQKTVPLSGLREMPIALPPISEQKKIISKVRQLTKICEEMGSLLLKGQKLKGLLADTVFMNQ